MIYVRNDGYVANAQTMISFAMLWMASRNPLSPLYYAQVLLRDVVVRNLIRKDRNIVILNGLPAYEESDFLEISKMRILRYAQDDKIGTGSQAKCESACRGSLF